MRRYEILLNFVNTAMLLEYQLNKTKWKPQFSSFAYYLKETGLRIRKIYL